MNIIIKRLNRDFRELQKNPIPGVGVEPLENNMMIWHFTIMPPERSVYFGIPFHGNVEFNEKFPVEPPNIYFHHYISSREMTVSEVNGKYSPCMSLNQSWIHNPGHKDWINATDHGWSVSSTMTDFFLQIQFLFFQLLSSNDSDIKKQSLKYICNICGHNGSNSTMYRPVIQIPLKSSVTAPPVPEKFEIVINNGVPEVIPEPVSEPVSDLIPVMDIIREYEPVCYVSKDRILYTKGDEIYGMLWNIEDSNAWTINFSFMSNSIWNTSNIRITHEKQPVNFFVPLFFNKEHWSIAKGEFKIAMSKLIIDHNLVSEDETYSYPDEYYHAWILIEQIRNISDTFKTKKKTNSLMFLFFYINQTIQQLIDQVDPQIFLDNRAHILFSRDPNYTKSLDFLIDISSIIRESTDKIKSMTPDIFDISSITGKADKVFHILKYDLIRLVFNMLISKFNCTHDHLETINDQIAKDWIEIFDKALSIKNMTELFNILLVNTHWTQNMVNTKICQILGLRDKHGKSPKSSHKTRLHKHTQKKVKKQSNNEN